MQVSQALTAPKPKTATRRRYNLKVSVAAVLFAIGIGPGPYSGTAHACAFDLTKPDRTAIDWILEADTLVLARPDPENPFSYQVIEVLRGDQKAYNLPFLVTSVNRQMLKNNSGDSVLFRKTPEDGWAQVTYVDDAFANMLALTLDNAEIWGSPDYHPTRFATFEALQISADPKLRELAVRELDKAPYEMLRTLDMQFEVDDLLSDIWTPAGYPFQSIRVLLLGLSGDPRARTAIYRYLNQVRDWDTPANVGAFAAALVQLDGVQGVAYLNDAFLSDPHQPLEKMQGIVSALAVHRGLDTDEVNAAIDQDLARVVMERPEVAPVVAHQFLQFSNWSQAAVLSRLVRERRLGNLADLMSVSVYVGQARDAGVSVQTLLNEG